MSLEYKTVLITGASKGIGKALALRLAAEKMNLILIARSENELQNVKKEVDALETACLVFVGSVADEAFVKDVVRQTIEAFGRIDYMTDVTHT